MIEWLRRMFSRRHPDPDLARVRAEHAARSARVDGVAARASAVSAAVVRDSNPMRASFDRAERRLGGR